MKYTPKDKVEIYTKKPCPYCDAAKRYFSGNGIPYLEYDLTAKFDEMIALKNRTKHMTFPQIFINDQFIGGYDDLMKLVEP